jgi:hypothetical protein
MKFWEELLAYLHQYDTVRIENDASNNSIVAVTFLTEPLSRNDRRDAHLDTQTDGKDLWSMPLRWAQVIWYTRQVS